MTNQQGAPEALTDFERRHAIRQGHEIAASDGYFEARPQIDSNDRRYAFRAGFERGWDRHAALVEAQQPAPSAAAAGNFYPHAELRKTWQPGQRWQARSFRNGQWGPWTDAVASEPFWFPHQDYRRHPDDLAPQPSPTPQADSVTAPAGGVVAGIEAAAKLLERKADDFARKNGSDDLGGLSFGRGAHADAKLEYHSTLLELAEEIRSLAPTPPAQAADSVLEDAAREVLMEHSGCGSGTQVDMLTVRLNPGDKVVMLKGRITQGIDAARKQGGAT